MTDLFRRIVIDKRWIVAVLSFALAIFFVNCAANLKPSLSLNQTNSQEEEVMSAFIVFNVKIKDSAKWKEYVPQAGATIGEFGGELLIRGAFAKMLSGDAAAHQLGGVIRFPSVESINKWYTSDVYSPLIPLRDEAAEVTQTIYTATD